MTAANNFNYMALMTLYQIGRILGSSLVLRDHLRQVLSIVADQLQMQLGSICLVQDSGDLSMVASIGLTPEEMRRAEFSPGEGVTGQIFKHAIPAVVPDVSLEPLFLNKTGAYKALGGQLITFLGVPIKAGGECIGVLSFQFARAESPGGFAPKLQLLTMVADLIGQSVRLSQQIENDRQQWQHERLRLQKDLASRYQLPNVIGRSKPMQEVFAEVRMVAPGDSTILLRGESGTGKEVIARAIHFMSGRKAQPFIKVNCAALSESLLESELFGHEKGAFTGALKERKGRFEQADGCTFFLDEIGEISPAFQVKLLRVLQEREFERVGGNKTIKVNVRFIFATNRNLEEAVSNGQFRADLYYRINVISISLPPLRERREDIPLLVESMLSRLKRNVIIAPAAMQVLANCDWPGNVRELENCVERFSIMCKNGLVNAEDIPCQSGRCFSPMIRFPHPHQEGVADMKSIKTASAEFNPVILQFQPRMTREQLIQVMEKSGWVQAKAARVLGITARQIGYALKKHNIEIRRL